MMFNKILTQIGVLTPPKTYITGDPNAIAGNALSVGVVLLAILAVVYIMYAGYKFITAYGEAGKIKEAQNALMYAVIGLVVVLIAGMVTNFVYKTLTGNPLPGLPTP